MWISKGHYNTLNELIESSQARNTEMLRRDGERIRLEVENARLRADLDWFKLRLNQVEKERQMLMLDRLGIKIPVPEFVPVQDMPDEIDAMNGIPDLSMVGDDAPSDFNPAKEFGPDYSGLPVRANN